MGVVGLRRELRTFECEHHVAEVGPLYFRNCGGKHLVLEGVFSIHAQDVTKMQWGRGVFKVLQICTESK